jgi:hypothetical protein
MTKIKGLMMSSEALEPAGFISEYQHNGTSGIFSDTVQVDNNDDIYLYSTAMTNISGVNSPGNILAKVEADPEHADFGLVTDFKLVKMTSGGTSATNSFAVTSNYVHSALLNYVNTGSATGTRNYVTHFRTDKNFNSPTPLNSYNFNALASWGATNSSIISMVPDTSDGIYAGFQFNQNSSNHSQRGVGILKLNVNSSQQWKRFITGSSDNTYQAYIFADMHANANGYSALAAEGGGGATGVNDVGVVGLFNSSGGQQWVKMLKNGEYWTVRGVHVDSNQNVYICADNGPNTGYGYKRPVIVKLNSSGVLQWCKKLSITLPSSTTSAGWAANIFSKNIAVHGDDIYISIRYEESDPRNNVYSLDYRCGIMKLDTSGNFGYYHEITSAANDTGISVENKSWHKNIDVDSQGNVIMGFRGPSNKSYLMKIPQSKAQSGAFTGTYLGDVKISALSNGSLPTNPITITDWVPGSTTSPFVLTSSNASLTNPNATTTTNNTSYLY